MVTFLMHFFSVFQDNIASVFLYSSDERFKPTVAQRCVSVSNIQVLHTRCSTLMYYTTTDLSPGGPRHRDLLWYAGHYPNSTEDSVKFPKQTSIPTELR